MFWCGILGVLDAGVKFMGCWELPEVCSCSLVTEGSSLLSP